MYTKFFTFTSLLLVLLLYSFQAEKSEPITAETALQSYLQNGDQSFAWEIKESFSLGGITVHELLLTSQQWREHTWTHQLTVLVPQEIK